MTEPLLLHPHPAVVRPYFPGYRVQRSAADASREGMHVLYFPNWSQGVLPDLAVAQSQIEALQRQQPSRVILVSSALFHDAGYRNPGLMSEARTTPPQLSSPVAQAWRALEQRFQDTFPGRLCILRAVPCPLIEPDSLFGALLQRRQIPLLRRFDPPLQFLHPDDLAQAAAAAWSASAVGIFNIAPSMVLRPSLLVRDHGWQAVPVKRVFPGTSELRRAVANRFRYPGTLSTDKAGAELGFRPAHSSHAALGLPPPPAVVAADLDPFGMDRDYIAKHCRGIARLLHERYFRIEYRGEERLPTEGNAILLGIHRGFMPFDALMLLTYFVIRRNSILRVPTHPSLLKTPVPFNFPMLGGIPAFADNIDHIIRSGQWVLMFPEGITGAFKRYKDAYQLGSSGFREAVECAIRNQVPIVPVVTVGSAEIFPILGKLHWPWLQRTTLWPEFPLAPPFPLLPIPLPTKWRTQFLEPVHLEQAYAPEDAGNRDLTTRLGAEIRDRMQAELLGMRAARKSWWW
jgi:1-acyl-sn-glycerol-3-phosphate acyltransferase